jgi:hypothetical protein
MAYTALDYITSALRKINSYQPGEQLATTDANDCLEVLNDLLDSWSTQKLHIYGTNENIVQWVNGQFQYKIGNPLCTDLGEKPFTGTLTANSNVITGVTNIPVDLKVGASLSDVQNLLGAGVTVQAIGTNTVTMTGAPKVSSNGADSITYSVPGDFAFARPLRITYGFTRINMLDFPFDVYATQEEYNSILFKSQPGPWPTVGWYNNVFPYGVLNVYQAPGMNAEAHIFTDTILSNLTINQLMQLPQGYARALKWVLAKELWPEYWGTQPLPDQIAKNAHDAVQVIKALNAQPTERARYDSALLRGGMVGADWITHGGFK